MEFGKQGCRLHSALCLVGLDSELGDSRPQGQGLSIQADTQSSFLSVRSYENYAAMKLGAIQRDLFAV